MVKMQLFYKKKFGFGNKKNDIVKLGKIENDKFYELKSYNKFYKNSVKIPKWNKIDVPKKVIETFFEGKNEKNIKELIKLSKKKLYNEAIKIEQQILKENVGSQDQANAAYGGFNFIEFNNNNIKVDNIKNKKNINTITTINHPRILIYFSIMCLNASPPI